MPRERSMVDGITKALKRNRSAIGGFGTFTALPAKSRAGIRAPGRDRHPASKLPKFKAGKD
jgi:nucleoid DNA-binding protein